MKKFLSAFRAPSRLDYDKSGAWGLLTSIDIHDCNPASIRNAAAIREFTKHVCKKIRVKTFGKPMVIEFGDDPRVHGYSLVQLIESSLVSGHFAESSESVYLDIFSCKYYNAQIIIDYAMRFFGGKHCNAHAILRGSKINLPKAYLNRIANKQIILQGRLK